MPALINHISFTHILSLVWLSSGLWLWFDVVGLSLITQLIIQLFFRNDPANITFFASVVKYPCSGWNTKWFFEPFSEKYLVSLRTLFPFSKSIFDPFFDISLISLDR